MAKVLTYKSIIDAGGVIQSASVDYDPDKCFIRTKIIDFSNVKYIGNTSLPEYKCINEDELEIIQKTLTSISTASSFTKGSGGSSVVTVTATYSDGTAKDVTASCTITITNASATGVASWNASTLKISHGSQGTATLNVSYTEGGVTKTTTAQISTTPVFPVGYTINPSSVTVEVGRTVNVSVIGHLNNDVNTQGGFTYGYVNNIGSSYFSFSNISGGIAVSGLAVGSGNISVGYSSGAGATAQIPVTVIRATKALIINGATSIPKNTSISGGGYIYFKTYDADGNELTSINVTNSCNISVNNSLLTVTKESNELKFVSGNTSGTSIITATYTYNGEVYTDTHTVSITDPASVYVQSVNMSMQQSGTSRSWVMAVTLSDGSTVYPQYTAKCTMSQADSSYVGRTFGGPLSVSSGSTYVWAFTTTSNSVFYNSSGTQFYPSSGGTFSAGSTWRPS